MGVVVLILVLGGVFNLVTEFGFALVVILEVLAVVLLRFFLVFGFVVADAFENVSIVVSVAILVVVAAFAIVVVVSGAIVVSATIAVDTGM